MMLSIKEAKAYTQTEAPICWVLGVAMKKKITEDKIYCEIKKRSQLVGNSSKKIADNEMSDKRFPSK
jgi:hypothetical protein